MAKARGNSPVSVDYAVLWADVLLYDLLMLRKNKIAICVLEIIV